MRIGVDGDVSRRISLEHWQAQIQGMHTSMARLSSGLRINAAVDDAAGLAIAEGLRSQVLGARQAQLNAQDGVSLLRVACGALEQTAGLLQRMRVIAVEAATGTWSDTQRAALQLLMDGSLKGIDDIASATAYNAMHLLDGSRGTITLQVGARGGDTRTVTFAGAAANDLGLGTAATTVTTYHPVTTTTPDQTITTTIPDQIVTTPGPDQVVTSTTTTYSYAASSTKGGPGTVVGQLQVPTSATAPLPTSYTAHSTGAITDSGGTRVGTYDPVHFVATFDAGGSISFANSVENGGSGKGTFTVTATPHTTTTTTTVPGQPITTVIPGTTTTTVVPGTTTTTMVPETTTTPGTGVSVLTQDAAAAAIGTIDAAIELISDQRSSLGSAETGLEHTIALLGLQEVSFADAEGRIRDVDVAAEVTRLAKLQIAVEAGAQTVSQALLAQCAAVNVLLGTLAPPARESAPKAAGPGVEAVAGSAGARSAGSSPSRSSASPGASRTSPSQSASAGVAGVGR